MTNCTFELAKRQMNSTRCQV